MATQADIQALYQRELGRSADPSGLDFYTNLANQGTSLDEIARQINASTEGTSYNQANSNLTPGQAQQLYNAYQSGDTAKVQNLVNAYGVTANDVQQYFPGFDTSTLAGENIYLTGQRTTPFNLNAYNASNLDPYTRAAMASSAANLQNAQAAVAANRVNQVTPYGNLTYTQTTDASGNPVWTATQNLAPEFQQAFGNIAGQVAQGTAQGFNPTLPSTGINPGETYEAAIMRRLQPQQAQASEALEVQLANQGIMPGSEAYNRAKTQLAQAQNDQLTSAVVGGFNTGLAANQQAYGQALTNYQLPLATMNQFRTATAPSYVNPAQQATVAGPDYLGAYTAQSNYNLGLQNAQNASNAGLTSGLFGLGSAALLNPTGVSQAYGAISSGLNKLFG